MAIDEGIEGIRQAARRVGVVLADMPAGTPGWLLEEMDWAVAPMRLPEGLRALLSRHDLGRFPVTASPAPLSPRAALALWSGELARIPAAVPRCLFPLAHDGMSFTFVELAGPEPEDAGGQVWAWSFGAQRFELLATDVSDWLALLARAIVTGAYTSRTGGASPGTARVHVPPDAFRALAATRMRRLPEEVAPARRIGARAETWPAKWLISSGLLPADLRPRGAGLPIADLIARAATESLTATIAGEVVDLVGDPAGVFALTTEGDAELWVYCPRDVSLAGPRLRRPFEFDVMAGPWPDGRRPRLLERVWPARLAKAIERSVLSGPRVVAEAVRPVAAA